MSETALLTPTDDVLYGTSIEDALYPTPPPADKLMVLVDEIIQAIWDAQAIRQFSLPFQARWQDDVLAKLEDMELQNAQVWVVDAAENLLPATASHGCPIEEYEVLVIIQRKFDPTQDNRPVECRRLSALVGELTQFCRRTCVADATCIKTVRDPARNLEVYNTGDLFHCTIQTTWHRMYDGE